MAVPSGITLSSYTGMGPGGHITPPYYADFLRENLYGHMYHRQLGTLVQIPRGHGDKVRIPRWQTPLRNKQGMTQLSAGNSYALTAINVNVGEGNVITPQILCAESICGSVVQFAGARRYSDKLIIISKANFIEGALESLGRELSFRLDRYTRVNTSANAFLVSSNASTTKTTSTDLLYSKVIAKLGPMMDAGNVPRWEDETFVLLANPLLQHTLFTDISATGFVTVARYGDWTRIYRGEVGTMYGIRFLLSTAVPVIYGASGSTSGTTYMSGAATGSIATLYAPDAFYSLELEDGGVEVLHMPPGSSGSISDPAAQVGSVAVKVFYGVTPAPTVDRRQMRVSHGLPHFGL